MATIHIVPGTIEGKPFVTELDSKTEFTCIGYATNDTFLVVGARWDQASNRTIVRTFKINEVKFIGNALPVAPTKPS